jgi:hypothetical protein
MALAHRIWSTHREIEIGAKLLAEMRETIEIEELAATPLDRDRRRHLQLGVPSGTGHRLFDVAPDLAITVIEAHIAGKRSELAAASALARMELDGIRGILATGVWAVMMGQTTTRIRHEYDVPHDPADFGRCYRLLKVMPSWRARLPEVAARFPEWRGFVDAWDELTALYEEALPAGPAPKLYARMQELRHPRATAEAPNPQDTGER